MLNMSRTAINRSREIAFVPGYQAKEEGLPLVSMLVSGVEAVKEFEGEADKTAGARFAGFSYSETLTPVTANYAMDAVTDSDGHVLLPYEPITGQISVYTVNEKGVPVRLESSSVTIDADNPRMITIAASSKASAPAPKSQDSPKEDGDASSDSGTNLKVKIVFKYMPTLQSAFFEHRVLIPSVSASAMTNSTGVILEGEVWTDHIDLSSDFDNGANKLYVSADGLVAAEATVPDTGIEIPNAVVIGTPAVSGGFLGIRF